MCKSFMKISSSAEHRDLKTVPSDKKEKKVQLLSFQHGGSQQPSSYHVPWLQP